MGRKIIVFDVESTGLPVFDRPSESSFQPRITEIAAQLVDEDSQDVIAQMDTLIRPDGWTIPPDCVALNGITTEDCDAEGITIAEAVEAFLALDEKAALRVAHNEPFDCRMFRIEFLRLPGWNRPRADAWKARAKFCTMRESKKIVDARTEAGKPKPPKLSEAYEHFTGRPMSRDAHRATVDVEATKAVYFGLLQRERTKAGAGNGADAVAGAKPPAPATSFDPAAIVGGE